MEAIAKLRHIKGSPRKARLVIDLIRGRNVSHALAILKFTNKRAAQPIAKCLNSAIANATYLAEQKNIAVDPDDLWVKTCFVDMGAHKNRRRMRPAPQGRAYREQRHYCHITIEVTSDAPAKNESDKPRKEGKKLQAKRAQAENEAKTKPPKKTAQAEQVKKDEEIQPLAAEQQANEATNEQFEQQEVENKADAADVKDAESQTEEEVHDTKRADDKQEAINEQLERQ